MHALIDLFLHLDVHLAEITASYGLWIYAILFAIIFAETGLVVTPFLPGDSLLFACGALAATGVFNPLLTVVLLAVAAIVGNTVNYSVGRYVGMRVFTAGGPAGGPIACSIANISNARTRSSNAMAGRRSSSAASCRSCERSCRSSQARRK